MDQYIVLQKNKVKEPVQVAVSFLRTLPAIMRYGRCTLYADDIYYIPYRLVKYKIKETQETYVFLCSYASEDIAVLSGKKNSAITAQSMIVDSDRIVEGQRSEKEIKEEIQVQIKLDKAIRKAMKRYHLEYVSSEDVLLPEKVFYAKGKSTYVFLVDLIQEKVDFRHVDAVSKLIAENYLRDHPELKVNQPKNVPA